MNGIVRVTDKPVKLIDALHCEMAKEARRLSESLDQWSGSSLETLARTVAAAEVMVATPEFRRLSARLMSVTDAGVKAASSASWAAKQIVELPKRLDKAAWGLEGLVKRQLNTSRSFSPIASAASRAERALRRLMPN
jgi:hypothetical protein